MRAVRGSPANTVGISIGDYWESGTTLHAGSGVEEVVDYASEAELGIVAGLTLDGAAQAQMTGYVLVVRIRAYIHTDLSHWVSIEREWALADASVGVVEAESIIGKIGLGMIGTPDHTLLELIGGIGPLRTTINTRIVDRLAKNVLYY